MANNDEKWYFTKEQLDNTPSRRYGLDAYKELQYRQQAANFIQDMGQRLKVTQLCINTAIVYMHRFYVFHSFTHFPWQSIASAALFLAAKVEEQPRKLEHVIKVALLCKNHSTHTNFDINSERYLSLSHDLVFNENILLQTLGFDVAIDHPHTHVVKCCHLVRASKDLAQTSYFLASNSLHLTTMCLQYRPTVVACFCILLACKWSNWEIPLSNEQKEWYSYIDPTVTASLLQQLCLDFLEIYDRCPSRLKEKVMIMQTQDNEKKNQPPTEGKDYNHRSHHSDKTGHADDPHKHRPSRPHEPGSSSSSSQQQREREYREKKERERLAQHGKQMPMGQSSGNSNSSSNSSSNKPIPIPHGHHRPPIDKMKQHPRPPSGSGNPLSSSSIRPPENPRDILRESIKDSGSRYSSRDMTDPTLRDSHVKDISREMQRRSNATDSNSVNTFPPDNRAMYGVDKPTDSSRSRPVDPNKYPPKHESARRHEEDKHLFPKSENDISKKHSSSNMYDRNSSYGNKPQNSTSHKTKSPYDAEMMKAFNKSAPNYPSMKVDNQNGGNQGPSTSSGYAPPTAETRKQEPFAEIKEEPHFPLPVKKPSLFSPEKSPPRKTPPRTTMTAPVSSSMKKEFVQNVTNIPDKYMQDYDLSQLDNGSRTRRPSSSEPELRPVMKKIEQMEGFENLLSDSGIKVPKVPDMIAPITDILPEKQEEAPISKELKPPDIIPPFSTSTTIPAPPPLVNGIETNPTLISNLLKEAPPIPHLPTITTAAPPTTEVAPIPPPEKPVEPKEKEREHHHKSKKKNKEKHKHKDKDRSRDEKKKKHKDKDRERHKSKSDKHESQPIKITIPKDKIQPPEQPPPPVPGLKIKIPKDRLKADTIEPPAQPIIPSGGLKIKIPKDVIKNNSYSGESKKRERERDKNSPPEGPPSKSQKSSYGSRVSDSKQNGRNSYNKVAHMGDGDTSMHRLAESKYNNKGAPL